MTPQQKAQELINAYTIAGWFQRETIECAIVCVDQIIKAEPSTYSAWERVSTQDYWQQVKEELQKL